MKTSIFSLISYAVLMAGFFSCTDKEDVSTSLTGFEGLNLENDTYYPGNEGDSLFETEHVIFPNVYDKDYGFLGGFAYSSMSDTVTPGFQNQFSSFAGSGALNSRRYGVANAYSPVILYFKDSLKGHEPQHLYVSNSTYAALSMKNGDDFAKKFGGPDGNDEDWYKLGIEGIAPDNKTTAKIELYLADYRFDDRAKDYILDGWEKVDLTPLGTVKQIRFSLTSSDVGDWGMNTPSIFCIDNLKTKFKE